MIKTENSVLDSIFRGQDKDGRLNTALSQRSEDIDTIAPRQHKVEEHKVERALTRKEESLFAGSRRADFVVFRRKPFAECFGDLSFILDDQDAHSMPIWEPFSNGQYSQLP